MNSQIALGQTGEAGGVSLAEEASRFRTALIGDSRSTMLVNLFDYLLERVDDERAPKEIEIAIDVFGKSGAFDTSVNSMVRSYMHRLRQRLDKFNEGKSGLRLTIPKGEYRLILSEMPELEDEDELEPITLASRLKRISKRQVLAIFLCVNGLLWAAAFLFASNLLQPSPLARTALWKPLMANGRMPVIAVGDFYMIAESGDEGIMTSLRLDTAIQSEADLSKYLTLNPRLRGKLHARDIYRVSGQVAKVAVAVLKQVSEMHPGSEAAEIMPVSRMSQDLIDSNSIIYIQYFSQLGVMRSPFLRLSGFAPTDDFDEIKDKASGKVYRIKYAAEEEASNGGNEASAHSYGIDYGYLASFPGRSGNHNILISGGSDEGLAQVTKIVSDKRQLDSLAKRTGGAGAFEALYQVRTVGGLVFDTKLLIARPLKTEAMQEMSQSRASRKN
ncbi:MULTISPECIES: hypothetical protein [Novosphingobium]|uniref:Uncharacterized protein n=1 Tax=Novosphingobium mathurense TaxID=428990 RepID=A0A1U6HGR0_9SPHN|nr:MULTISPECIES: hypothetical protein [Novosphingobium]SLJ94985.1 hypothetical protein SAMN06295987_102368 [Novosphingobium mathurense]